MVEVFFWKSTGFRTDKSILTNRYILVYYKAGRWDTWFNCQSWNCFKCVRSKLTNTQKWIHVPWFTQLRNISLRVGISDFGHFCHFGPQRVFFVMSLLFCPKLTDRDADCCVYLRNGYCCQKKYFWEDFPKIVFLYRPKYTILTFDTGGGWVIKIPLILLPLIYHGKSGFESEFFGFVW